MNTITITPAGPGGCELVQLGVRGENEVSQVLFDFSSWDEEFGAGIVSLLVKRPGDTAAYPVSVTSADNVAVWNVSSTDTYRPGMLRAEWIYTVGTLVAKTAVFDFRVVPDIGDPSIAPPDPYETWLDTLVELGAETQKNAEDAADSADAASDSADAAEYAQDAAEGAQGKAEDAQEAAEAAQTAAEAAVLHYPKIEGGYWYVWSNNAWVNTGVKAEGVDGPGIASVTGVKTSTQGLTDTYTVTVTYTEGAPSSFTFTVTNGFSPSASVSKNGGTVTVTITDENGTTTASVTDGVSPVVTITTITGGHRVTITDADHPSGQSFDVMDGGVQVSDLLKAFPIDSASGAIASLTDGADGLPVKALTVQISPIQDLHGYDSPWPAGGGKNLFPTPYEITSGSVYRGITISYDEFGVLTLTGTGDGGAQTIKSVELPAGTYKYYCEEDSSDTRVYLKDGSITLYSFAKNDNPFSFTLSESKTMTIQTVVLNGKTVTNSKIKVMIEAGTTASGWSPYANFCPISGRTGADVFRTGVNVWDEEWEVGTLDSSGQNIPSSLRIRSVNYIPVIAGENYYCVSPNRLWAVAYDNDKNIISDAWNGLYYKYLENSVFTAPVGAHYIRFVGEATTYNNDISINYPSTDHDYHAYSGKVYALTFKDENDNPITVYGGNPTYLGGGNWRLTVTMAMVDLGTLADTWHQSSATPGIWFSEIPNALGYFADNGTTQICSAYANSESIFSIPNGTCRFGNTSKNINIRNDDFSEYTPAQVKTAMSGVQLVYELATPLTYTLTTEQLTTLLGQNNVWADCGDVALTIYADPTLYIDKKIAEATV